VHDCRNGLDKPFSLLTVAFDGAIGDGKLLGYLAIVQPSPEEDGDLLFAVGDPFGRFVSRW
jgi:hypothetical protein